MVTSIFCGSLENKFIRFPCIVYESRKKTHGKCCIEILLIMVSLTKATKRDAMRRRVSWQENVVILGGDSMSAENKHAANEFEILSFVENGINSKIYDVVQKQRNRKFIMEVVPRNNKTDVVQHDDDMSPQNTRLHKHSQFKAPSCYLTKLKYSFQTKSRKYFVLSHLDKNKNLKVLLEKRSKLNDMESRFIIAELVVAIETLHVHGIPYGSVTADDIYFDKSGHVMLKRTYNEQMYWTKNECYECHNASCKNPYHNDSHDLSQILKAYDWKGVGQLSVYMMTGDKMAANGLQGNPSNNLSKNAREFMEVLLADSIDVEKIKSWALLNDTDWEQVQVRENEVPESLKLFVSDTNSKKPKHIHKYTSTTDKTLSDVKNTDDNPNITPKILVEGVRKQRTKSEDHGKRNDRTRSKSCNQGLITSPKIKACSTSCNQGLISNPRVKTRSISCSDQPIKNTSLQIPEIKEKVERKKSIEIYTKRLQEISNVLDKNRAIRQSLDMETDTRCTNPITHTFNKSSWDTPYTTSYTKTYFDFNGDKDKDLVKKIYSENDAIRTILSKYGLLKTQDKTCTTENQDVPVCKDTQQIQGLSGSNNSTQNFDVDRETSRKKTTSGDLPSTSYEQTAESDGKLTAENDERLTAENDGRLTVESDGRLRSRRRPRSTKPKLSLSQEVVQHAKSTNVHEDEVFAAEEFAAEELSSEEISERAQETTHNSTSQLINKLNGLSKSTTFYMKKDTQIPHSSHMKRHQSDPITKPSVIVNPASRRQTFNEAWRSSTTAPQSLLKALNSAPSPPSPTNINNKQHDTFFSNTVFVKQKSTSCDSGLSESIDEDRDDHSTMNKKTVERNDSGVGRDKQDEQVRVWKPRNPDLSFLQNEELKIRANKEDCYDCGQTNVEEPFPNPFDTLCLKCGKSRIERKQAITELIETEVNYGEDLKILKEEFYTPIKKNSICTTDEMSKLFLNLQELVDVNAKLCMSLQYGLESCFDQDDAEYINLGVGEIFLNNVQFFEAYELYCAKHNDALDLLTSVQKKSDLLRIFLFVSSQENSKLRKMDLKSFLTMPVQRIMKYPLLLSRIHKHTPTRSEDRKNLKEALLKVEDQISKINDLSRSNSLRTPRAKRSSSFSSLLEVDSLDINDVTKLVANQEEWKLEETQVLLQEEFEVVDHDLINLTAWNKNMFKKITYLRAVLCVNGAPDNYQDQMDERIKDENSVYTGREIKDAVVILLKQKYIDRCMIYKQPLKLKKCILAQNPDIPIAFDLCEKDRNHFMFVARNSDTCKEWKRCIRFVIETFQLKWRQRRGAFSNIMIPNATLIQE